MNSNGRTFRERYFTAQDGLRLYYRDYGAHHAGGPVLLCLPGLARNSKDFDRLANILCGRYRVVSMDYRGRGRSEYDSDWRNYVPFTYINDVRHLLAVADIHRFVAVGTSMGGILAMYLSVAVPTAMVGAVINDIGPDVENDALDDLMSSLRHWPHSLHGWEDGIRYLQEGFPDLPADTDEEWLELAQNSYVEDEFNGIRCDWDKNILRTVTHAALTEYDFWLPFRAMRRIPVLSVRGEKSLIFSEKAFDRMAEAMPHLDRVTVPRVGHAPKLTEPEVLPAIEKLLESLAPVHE
jgi:pimeloyl-ACP methyl ester carboxylesterase